MYIRRTDPDEEFQLGDLAGSGGATNPVSGGIISREAFFEARMPLLDDMSWRKALDVETGYRYSDYNARLQDQHLQVRRRLGADFGCALARQLPARGARART